MDYIIIETKERVLADNDAAAERTRAAMKKSGTLLSLQRTAYRLNPLLLPMEHALTRRGRRGIQAVDRVLPGCSRGHCLGTAERVSSR